MLLTVKDVSKRLRVNVNYVYRLINSGLLPSIKIGAVKIREESLNEFLATYEGLDVNEILEKTEKRA